MCVDIRQTLLCTCCTPIASVPPPVHLCSCTHQLVFLINFIKMYIIICRVYLIDIRLKKAITYIYRITV